MTDLLFHDIVIESRSVHRGWRATCKTCSQVHRVSQDEFTHPTLKRLGDDGFTEFVPREAKEGEFLQYVAEIRAWNCCHYGETPSDGLPEERDAPRGTEWET